MDEKLKENYYNKALLQACDKGHEDLVKMLLKYGANIETTSDDESETPLMISCRKIFV